MDKQQAAERQVDKLHLNDYAEQDMQLVQEKVREATIAGWEAHEAQQCSTDINEGLCIKRDASIKPPKAGTYYTNIGEIVWNEQKELWMNFKAKRVVQWWLDEQFNPSEAATYHECPVGKDGDLKCAALDAVYEGAAEWEERCRSAEKILRQLVGLKAYKDRNGKDENYNQLQPSLWAKANKHITIYGDGYEKEEVLPAAPQAVGPVWVKDNYERLYARVKGGKRTACYVDYDFFKDGKPPIRDIAYIKPEQMEISARGICYAMMSSSCASEKERFVEMCESVNVEWLDESNAHQVFTREQVQAILTTLEKQPEYSKIYGYLDWFNTNYPPSI